MDREVFTQWILRNLLPVLVNPGVTGKKLLWDRFCREAITMKSEFVVNCLTDKEEKLIRLIRKIEYGEIKIIVQDKQPVRVEETKKSIKL
jgi:hypothetical protein